MKRIIMTIKPTEIEKKSMEIIDDKLAQRGITLPGEYAHIIKRAIHTTADFDFAGNMEFIGDVKGVDLRDTVIITDTNMTLSGLSKPGLGKLSARALCFMADEDVAKEAESLGITRAAVSVKKALRLFGDGKERFIYAVGNAPTALLELCDSIEGGFYPDLVIAVPVGFVNVVEAKDKMAGLCRKNGIPCIVSHGNKGGSTVSAAILNAMIYDELSS